MRRLVPILRSLAIYYGRPGRARRLRHHYGQFVPAGGLAFDVGAHVGNRTRAFLSLGARVVAVEPQPELAQLLRRLFGGTGRCVVEECALGESVGSVELYEAPGNLTVATTSDSWVHTAADRPGWERVTFQSSRTVSRQTLQTLIERHGRPDFVKIDAEGSEDSVLAGLGEPLPALSYEFLPADRDVAYHATLRLEHLAGDAGRRYEYNFSLGEELRLVMPDRWWSAAELQEYLGEIPSDGPSGDVYARLV